MRTFPRIALAIILSVVFLVQALGEKINANPSSSSYNQNATDQGATILSVEIGEKEEEIGYIYSKALNEGPEDFLIDEEGNILILDSCNKKILHYQNQVFIESISIDHCSLPSRILKINNHLYVLDYYSIWVYDLSKQTWSQAELPSVVEHFSVYVYDIVNDHDSLVLITELYGNYLLNEKSNSFDLTNRGYSSYRDGDHVIIERGDTKWTIHDETSSFRVIDFDDDQSLYVLVINDLLEPQNRAYCTVRKYDSNDKLLSQGTVNMLDYHSVPKKMAKVNDSDKVFILAPLEDRVEIVSFTLGSNSQLNGNYNPSKKVTSKQIEYLETEETIDIRSSDDEYGTCPISITRLEARNRATAMANYTWTFNEGNDKSYTGVTLPVYLQNLSKPHSMCGSLSGIPYSRGGFNGIDTVTNPLTGTVHENFLYMSLVPKNTSSNLPKKYTTGNTQSPTHYMTVGLDCSGYASSVYGFFRKAGTSHFYSDTTYFSNITWANLQSMDSIVKNGHIMLFDYCISSIQNTYSVFEENRTSETGRVMIRQRDKSTLQSEGYICKRPSSWSACSHSSKSYNYNANYHWKVCNLCGQKVTVDVAHTTIPYGGGYKCTVCGAVLPGVRSFSSPIHDEKTAINNAVLYVPSKHDCMAVIRFRRED